MIVGEDLKKMSNRNIMLLELSAVAMTLTGSKLGDEQKEMLNEDSSGTLASIIFSVVQCSKRTFERHTMN